MKQSYINVINILRLALYNKDIKPQDIIDPDWEELSKLLVSGKLDGITYTTINKLPPDYLPPADILNRWKTESFLRGVIQLMSVRELDLVLREAQKRGLNLIVFKGISLATLYPEPNMRFTSDSDIFVVPEDRDKVNDLLLEMGYTYIPGLSKDHVPTYIIDTGNRRLSIELHTRLWEDYEGEQTIFLDSLGLTNEENLIKVNACGIEIKTLGIENHLTYQIFHIIKHFALEGVGMRYLADLTLYVNKYISQIDLKHFWYVMKTLKYDIFADSVFKICVQHLEMNPIILEQTYSERKGNDRLLEDILLSGHMTFENKENWLAVDLLSPYFMRTKKIKKNQWQTKLHLFFPTPTELKDKFSYAKKYKFLLPIAWLHRIFSSIHYAIYCMRNGNSAMKIVRKVNYRLELLKEVGLVDFEE